MLNSPFEGGLRGMFHYLRSNKAIINPLIVAILIIIRINLMDDAKFYLT